MIFLIRKGKNGVIILIGTNYNKLPQVACVCLSVCLFRPQTTLTCLMVVEAWHREWSGESLNSMAQISDASHSLRVLNKEVFEFLELS